MRRTSHYLHLFIKTLICVFARRFAEEIATRIVTSIDADRTSQRLAESLQRSMAAMGNQK